ncbi:hypothetical protein R1flu_027805 [Riccia fluitans]|uniref:Uncharacterized protein n=1 Tax=Riccia fluitans TaxID=41844 RepID=A0ABD1XJV3_9MARC
MRRTAARASRWKKRRLNPRSSGEDFVGAAGNSGNGELYGNDSLKRNSGFQKERLPPTEESASAFILHLVPEGARLRSGSARA